MSPIPTPSQTVGPFLAIGLVPLANADLVAPGSDGALWIEGRLLDGAGAPVPDGMLEIFQADPLGRFPPHTEAPWSGFGRCLTDAEGRFCFTTLAPGPVRLDSGELQAPHIEVLVFARGMLRPARTRWYLPGEAELALDPVLARIDEGRRASLVAFARAPARLVIDVHLQGEHETVFFGY
ncbi:MAG: protocatechuate 3,4-dioxygenase subunit alpha [Actinomycetota bacterium]|nr:protocatechuate 3,4-dioxygenase subunit alpha [Actinomycetota bacterium]